MFRNQAAVKNHLPFSRAVLPAAVVAALLATGCGGGGDSRQTTPAATVPTVSMPTPVTTGSDPVVTTPAVPVTTPVTDPVSAPVLVTDPVPVTVPVTVPADYAYTAATSFFSGGVTSSGTSLSGFSSVGARVVFTVNASAAGARPVNLSYTNSASTSTTLNVYVNGVYAATTTLAPTTASSKKQETLTLRAGINTITYPVS